MKSSFRFSGFGGGADVLFMAGYLSMATLLSACEPEPPQPRCPDDPSCGCGCLYQYCADDLPECHDLCHLEIEICYIDPSYAELDIATCAYCQFGPGDRP